MIFFFSSPLPPEELNALIFEASGQDISVAVLTQVMRGMTCPFFFLPSCDNYCETCAGLAGNHGLLGYVCALPARPIRRHAPTENRTHHASDGHRVGSQSAMFW